MSSDSRTEKYEISFQDLKNWVRFSGLKFWGRDLEKFQGKSGKKFKVLKLSKIIPKCPNVFWGNFFEIFFAQCSMESWKVFAKKSKKIQKCGKAQNCSQNCPNLLWISFVAFFPKEKLPRVPWRVGFWKISKKIKKFPKFHNWPKSFSKVSKRVLDMLWGNFSEFFCPVFHAGLFRFSGLKNKRPVFWT